MLFRRIRSFSSRFLVAYQWSKWGRTYRVCLAL